MPSTPAGPTAALSPLHRADGSATFIHHTTQILASVNGPMEIRARDEHYSKAVLDVVVRPSVGVATFREKFLESRLRSALEPIILLSMTPRTLIQVVIQIVQVGELRMKGIKGGTTSSNDYSPILLLPPILTTSLLALLDAGVPLTSTLDTFLLTINPSSSSHTNIPTSISNPTIHINPYDKPHLLHTAKSIHVLSYSTAVASPRLSSGGGDITLEQGQEQGGLILVESEGDFSWQEWEQVEESARRECMGLGNSVKGRADGDIDMKLEEVEGEEIEVGSEAGEGEGRRWGNGMMAKLVREVVEQRVARDIVWRK